MLPSRLAEILTSAREWKFAISEDRRDKTRCWNTEKWASSWIMHSVGRASGSVDVRLFFFVFARILNYVSFRSRTAPVRLESFECRDSFIFFLCFDNDGWLHGRHLGLIEVSAVNTYIRSLGRCNRCLKSSSLEHVVVIGGIVIDRCTYHPRHVTNTCRRCRGHRRRHLYDIRRSTFELVHYFCLKSRPLSSDFLFFPHICGSKVEADF